MTDGMQFDLGGRTVTAYECPGHTAGEMVFIDDQTHLMFAGDALNFNLGIGAVPVETTLKALRRLQAMQDQYTGASDKSDFLPKDAPPMNANKPQPPRKRVTYRKGRNFLGFNPNLIHEE